MGNTLVYWFYKRYFTKQAKRARQVILLLVIGSFFSSCQLLNKGETISWVNKDPKVQALAFMDSLQSNGVNRIIGYYLDCVDGQPYRKPPYSVFWYSREKWFTTKFTKTNRYSVLEGFSPPENLAFTNLKLLEQELLKEPKILKSSYSYEELRIINGEEELNFRVKDYVKEFNPKSYRVALLDSLKSVLSNIPTNKWEPREYATNH